MRVRRRLNCFLLALVLLPVVVAAGCSSGLKEVRKEIDDLRGITAQHTADLQQLREDFRELSGVVEEVQYSSVGKTRELEKKLKRFGSRVPPPEGVPIELLRDDTERISPITDPAADFFRSGLEQLRVGDFKGALRSFQGFAEQNPGTAFTDNALFWVGISAEKLGQYDRAILAFSDVFQVYPAEDRVPAALYYLGIVFTKTGSREDARNAFQKLIDEHSTSEFATKARKRMKELRKVKGRRGKRR